jgi:hypothetical protein
MSSHTQLVLLRAGLASTAVCLLASCAATHPLAAPPSSPPPVSETTTTSAATVESAAPPEGTAPECQLQCESPQMLPRASVEPDYTKHEIDNANAVLGAMKDDLLACYKRRLRVNPEAHGFITVDILIERDGRVGSVDTTGGAILGEATMACIVHRIERGVFEPAHGGGTLRVRVPFSLVRVAPGDET